MTYKDALNKSLALVLWAKDEDGEDDVAVFTGAFVQRGDGFFLQREGEENNPEIRAEWLPRIKPVPEELMETLMGCEYQLSLTVGPADDDSETMEFFGLTWPA